MSFALPSASDAAVSVPVVADVPAFVFNVAVIVAEPAPAPITRPDVLTVATLDADVDHVRPAVGTVMLLAFTALAVSCVVSPASMLNAAGVTVTVFAVSVPVTVDAPFLPPPLAVTVALPFETPVNSPDVFTVATPVADEPQVTVTPGTAIAFLFLGDAVRRVVSPASRLTAEGDTVIASSVSVPVTADVPDLVPSVAVAVVLPPLTPVSRPVALTVATPVAEDDHVTPVVGTVSPFLFAADTERRVVSPASRLTVAGVTVTELTVSVPVTFDVPLLALLVAVTTEGPSAAPVTRPEVFTVATPLADDVHVNVAPGTAIPFLFVPDAVRRVVSPASTVTEGGATLTAFTVNVPVAVLVPDLPPDEPVIEALPAPAPVTSPLELTVATPVAELAQVTVMFGTAMLFLLRPEAVRRVVSPASRVSVPGATVTVSSVSVPVSCTVPFALPDVAVMVAVPAPTPVATPEFETLMTPEAEDDQVMGASGIGAPPASDATAVSVVLSPASSDVVDAVTVTVATTGAFGSVPPKQEMQPAATIAAALVPRRRGFTCFIRVRMLARRHRTVTVL